jgi:AhpD family alkylhydroperoxidase
MASDASVVVDLTCEAGHRWQGVAGLVLDGGVGGLAEIGVAAVRRCVLCGASHTTGSSRDGEKIDYGCERCG